MARIFPRLRAQVGDRSEEHTSELQSLRHLVCRLLLEKKKKKTTATKLNNTHSTSETRCSSTSPASTPVVPVRLAWSRSRSGVSVLVFFFFFLRIRRPPKSTLFLYTTLFRSRNGPAGSHRRPGNGHGLRRQLS